MTQPNTPRMPVAFFGHGSPMNVIENNRYTEAWRKFGATIPRPKAILAVSAHWYTRSTSVTAMHKPRTIHDFGGFPQALFDIEYPASGDPALAARIIELLAPTDMLLDQSWGLDHGTWSVLIHAFPNADIPVVQLSIDRTQPTSFHYDIGKRLAPLRDEGVLIIGSGNVVHNLRTIKWEDKAAPYEWAAEFNQEVLTLLKNRDHQSLINYQNFGEQGHLSIPTPDHYLPLLYMIGLQRDDDAMSVIIDGIELASISMLSVAFSGG
jgi:4,5-DOPA dioxygenase extradiol